MPGGSIPDWKLGRRAISRVGCLYARIMLGLSVHDATAGFRAYHRRLLSRIDLERVRADGYGFQVEMTYLSQRAGAHIVEVPIEFRDRTLGRSKMSSRIVVEALLLVTRWGIRDRIAGVRRSYEDLRAAKLRACRSPSSPWPVRSSNRAPASCSCATNGATGSPTGARPAA